MQLSKRAIKGDRLALARLLSIVETGSEQASLAMDELFPFTGNAYLIGFTGPPGSGKSSLVNQLVRTIRDPENSLAKFGFPDPPTIAIVAVDPTSPFSGGAILGDRVRMSDLAVDEGVFIRSMANRGTLGGLAPTTTEMVQVFDAAGYDLVIIETVGAGQSEVEIASLAHTTVVVESPGSGDEVQAIKAGILEIADILVLNKADLPGTERTEANLRSMLDLAGSRTNKSPHTDNMTHHHDPNALAANHQLESGTGSGWKIPLSKTIATIGEGVDDLVESILRHRQFRTSGESFQYIENLRLRQQVDQFCQQYLVENWRSGLVEKDYNNLVNSVIKREISPRRAAQILTGE